MLCKQYYTGNNINPKCSINKHGVASGQATQITASDRQSIDLYPCKVNPRYTEEVDPKNSNKSKCGVYPDQAVPNIPQFGIRHYKLWYTVIRRV
jgi:hypothetical protein